MRFVVERVLFGAAWESEFPWEDEVCWVFVLVAQQGQVLGEMEKELDVAWSLLDYGGSDVYFCIESRSETI